jgi:hypothetical protein
MGRTMESGIRRTCIDHVIVEQTDPDYVCKYVARMAREYKRLSPHWREVLLEGICAPYRKDVLKMIMKPYTKANGNRTMKLEKQ